VTRRCKKLALATIVLAMLGASVALWIVVSTKPAALELGGTGDGVIAARLDQPRELEAKKPRELAVRELLAHLGNGPIAISLSPGADVALSHAEPVAWDLHCHTPRELLEDALRKLGARESPSRLNFLRRDVTPLRYRVHERRLHVTHVVEPPPPSFVQEGPGADEFTSVVDEAPMVYVARAGHGFLLDTLEVTVARYAAFLEDVKRGHRHCPPDEPRDKDHVPLGWDPSAKELPVTGVDWHDARAYAAWAGKRLPTAQEWQWAASGDVFAPYPWGDDSAFDMDPVGNVTAVRASWTGFFDRFAGAAPVGRFPLGASWCGALDLAGNAAEWTLDRALCGGSHASTMPDIAVTARVAAEPGARQGTYGFRCARDWRP
jgi:formylglycine-generating enzyme required for sulfatase activity